MSEPVQGGQSQGERLPYPQVEMENAVQFGRTLRCKRHREPLLLGHHLPVPDPSVPLPPTSCMPHSLEGKDFIKKKQVEQDVVVPREWAGTISSPCPQVRSLWSHVAASAQAELPAKGAQSDRTGRGRERKDWFSSSLSISGYLLSKSPLCPQACTNSVLLVLWVQNNPLMINSVHCLYLGIFSLHLWDSPVRGQGRSSRKEKRKCYYLEKAFMSVSLSSRGRTGHYLVQSLVVSLPPEKYHSPLRRTLPLSQQGQKTGTKAQEGL